jgi:prevent-host-death family protein
MAMSRKRGGKEYSIAEARDRFARIVHEAERGETVALTRRGKRVAVVLSHERYLELLGEHASLWDVVQRFRARHDMAELAIDPDEVWGGLRE